jgi:hypothetical protein
MGFNFPSSPTNGASFTDAFSGAQYVFNNGVWMQVSAAQIRLSSLLRNRIVNPCFQHSQENGNAGAGINAYYVADQWDTNFSTTGAVNALRALAVTPKGSQYRIALSVTAVDTSLVSGEYVSFRTKIEGVRMADFQWGTAGARPVVLTFGFVGPAGTYSVGLTNAGTGGYRSYIVSFAHTGGDKYYSFAIPGDTTGTWAKDNTLGLTLYFVIAANTVNLQAAPNAWTAGLFIAATGMSNGMAVTSAAAGSSFNLFDVGLYLDPDGAGVAPPWEAPDEAAELAACQRYWQIVEHDQTCFSTVTGTNYTMCAPLPAVMRIAPAISTWSGGSAQNLGTGAPTCAATTRRVSLAVSTSLAGVTYGIANRQYALTARM